MNTPAAPAEKLNLRAAMPQTTSWIDALREVFGKAEIDAQIRKGMQGLPGFFHARESGHAVGTADTRPCRAVSAADMVIIPPKKDPDANRNPRR